MIWWSLTIAPFHTYHPTPPRVPSRDRSRERRGGERSRRIDPDLWVFAGVIGVIILNQPKKLGVKNSWLPYFWGVYCRASWWNYQLPPPKPPKKKHYEKWIRWFFNFHFQASKTGVLKKWVPFFQGGLPRWLLQIKMVSWIQEKLSFKLPCEHGWQNDVSTAKI